MATMMGGSGGKTVAPIEGEIYIQPGSKRYDIPNFLQQMASCEEFYG